MKTVFNQVTLWLKNHKLLILIAVIVFLTLTFGVKPRLVAYLKGPAEKYETTKVKEGRIAATVAASGEVQAENQVILKFQTSGRLAWVGVKKGDRVEKWQALASLDKRELEKKLKKELNDYLDERWDFSKDREDYLVSTDDLDRYTLSNDIRRILEKAQFNLENTVIDVEIADLALKYATLITPIEGIVTEIDTAVAGVNITPATATFTVADPSTMKFVANIDEADIANIAVDQKVLLTLDAYLDSEFEGKIAKIAFAAITTRGGGTAFPVEILLPENSNNRFKIGMNGDAEIILDSKDNVLTVPVEAVKYRNGNTYVQIIEDKQVKEVDVGVGLENDNLIEITSGLTKGQTVITDEKED